MGPYNTPLYNSVPVIGAVPPADYAVGTTSTAAIDTSLWGQIEAVVTSGVLGASGTVDFNFTYCATSGGSFFAIPTAPNGSKAAINQITSNNTQATVVLRMEALASLGSYTNGARYVKGNLVVGTATSFAAAFVFGGDCRFAPASNYALSSVASNTLYTNSNTTA
jgi:hypothetical protein